MEISETKCRLSQNLPPPSLVTRVSSWRIFAFSQTLFRRKGGRETFFPLYSSTLITNKTGDSPKQTAEAPKTSAPASKPAAPAAAPNTNASTPPKSEKLPPKPQAEAPPIKAASPNAVQPHSVAAVPSALKPATEKGPVPAPVRVVDAPPVASKPNSTPPAAKTLPSAPPQDGPQ